MIAVDTNVLIYDRSVTVWRGYEDRQRSVAVIQYAGEDTFVARATHVDGTTSRGITTRHHRTRREAAMEAVRLSQILYVRASSENNSI